MVAHYRYKLRRFIVHHVLHADDTSHQFALGAAIAMFVAFLPIVGIQTVVSIMLAAIFRANKVICVPIVWITNPFTLVPIYSACYALGRFVWPWRTPGAELHSMMAAIRGAELGSLFTLTFWKTVLETSLKMGTELWVGCALVGFIGSLITYIVVRRAVEFFRARHQGKIARRKKARTKSRRARLSAKTS